MDLPEEVAESVNPREQGLSTSELSESPLSQESIHMPEEDIRFQTEVLY